MYLACTDHAECTIENSECAVDKCDCLSGFHPDNGQCVADSPQAPELGGCKCDTFIDKSGFGPKTQFYEWN